MFQPENNRYSVDRPRVALYGASREAAGGSASVGDKVPLSKPLIIGITGGIASGKSTVARMFAGRGIVHLDADKIVHDLMQHDRATIAAIAAAFPDSVTPSHDGVRAPINTKNTSAGACRHQGGMAIRRASLAAYIAQHPQDLKTLEAILHPRVRAVEIAAIRCATRQRQRAIILDIPLLFETDANSLCDIVIAAHAPLVHRRRRAFARPGMSEAKWEKLLARQWPVADRNHLADIVIPTHLGKAAARRMVQKLMREWRLA